MQPIVVPHPPVSFDVFDPSQETLVSEEVKPVSSVRRGGSVFILPPTEVRSGYTALETPEQIIAKVLAVTPRSSVIADPQTLKDFMRLPDKKYLELFLVLNSHVSEKQINGIIERCFSGENSHIFFINKAQATLGVYANLPQFIRLCNCEEVRRAFTRFSAMEQSA